jgi:hypothetical protein
MTCRPFLGTLGRHSPVGRCDVATTTTTASTPTTTQPTTTLPTTTPSTTTSEPWDLVSISDSFGYGLAATWANRIEEAEGVEVRAHEHAIVSLSLIQARQMVRDRETIREEIADAEIIFVSGNPDGSIPDDMGTCASASPFPRDPPEHNTPADFAPLGDVLRDILDEIFELRAGQSTVIRVADYFASPIADWREAAIEAECTAGWEAWSGVIREVADEYGVGMASGMTRSTVPITPRTLARRATSRTTGGTRRTMPVWRPRSRPCTHSDTT